MPVAFKFQPGETSGRSLNAVTTAGAGAAIPMQDARQVGWEVEGAGVISSGTVLIETASTPDYTGTWFAVDSIDASTLTGNALYQANYPNPMGGFYRGRVAPGGIVGGGNITVRFNGLIG